jgi:hypothetical protein
LESLGLGLGRLREAYEPMSADLQASIDRKDFKEAVKGAGNHNELYLAPGDVKQAIKYARQLIGRRFLR